jgi:hypothetical protein
VQQRRRLHHVAPRARVRDVPDLRFLVGDRGVEHRAHAGNRAAAGHGQHGGNAEGRELLQVRRVGLDEAGRLDVRAQQHLPFPAFHLDARPRIAWRGNGRHVDARLGTHVDEPGIDGQALAVDHGGVGWNRDSDAHRIDDAAADHDGARLDDGTGHGDDLRAANREHVRSLGGKTLDQDRGEGRQHEPACR